jgi:hypothetical protein
MVGILSCGSVIRYLPHHEVRSRETRNGSAHPAAFLSGATRLRSAASIDYADDYKSMIATARVQPADARSILTGKQDTVKPVDGKSSRLCSFSMWQ